MLDLGFLYANRSAAIRNRMWRNLEDVPNNSLEYRVFMAIEKHVWPDITDHCKIASLAQGRLFTLKDLFEGLIRSSLIGDFVSK